MEKKKQREGVGEAGSGTLRVYSRERTDGQMAALGKAELCLKDIAEVRPSRGS